MTNMERSEKIKEKIIETTIELIKKEDGHTEHITIRTIAEAVGVGTGLINYHFGTKENLIEICVQRIISNVISAFHPAIYQEENELVKLKTAAKQVVDFFLENPEISRVSILGDMNAPKILDNTAKTVLGFMGIIKKEEKEIKWITYCFTLVLQGIFLRRNSLREDMGFNMDNKTERDSFIDFIIDRMYGTKLP
jgi:Transcriptional regulator